MGLISISFQPENPISKKHLKNGFDNNEDGAGFAYLKDGKIIVRKGFFTFNSFYEEYKKIRDFVHLVNFRQEKQGGKTISNCGPFLLTNKLAVAHSGFFTQPKFDSDIKSDTRIFIEKILLPLIKIDENILRSRAIKFLLKDLCGMWDQLVFFYADCDEKGRHFSIINSEKGCFESKKNHWFSGHEYGYSFRNNSGGSVTTAKKYNWEFDSTKNPYNFDEPKLEELDAVSRHINEMGDDEFARFEAEDDAPPEDESDFDARLRRELILREFRRDDETIHGMFI